MGQSVTVTCPECGETLKLKSRGSLGKRRPCPKCEVPFVLDEDTNQSSYDLDLDARGVSPRPDREKPMLKRGASRQTQSSANSSKGPALDIQNKPLLLGLGAGGLISVGMLLAWIIIPRGDGPAPVVPQSNQDSAVTPASEKQNPTAPVPSGSSGSRPQQTTVAAAPRRHPGDATPDSSSSSSTGPSVRPQDSGNVDWSMMQAQGFDLLASTDPAQDTERGNWSRDGNTIVSRGNGILAMRFTPVDDYRVSASFVRESGNQQINLILPVPGGQTPRQFLLVIDWRGGGDHGVETLRGATPGRGNPTNNHTVPIENGNMNRVNMDVVAKGPDITLRATMNGQALFEWTGAATDLKNPYWPTSNKRHFGLGSGSGNGGDLVIRYQEFVVTPISKWGWTSLPRGVVLAGSSAVRSPSTPARSPEPVVADSPPARQPSTPQRQPEPEPVRSTPTPPLTATTSQNGAERWWQFRGSDFNRTAQTGFPTRWSENENVVWKVDLPDRGGSSPIVVGDRVFVTSYSGYGTSKENPGNPKALVRHLWVIDRNSGNVIRDHKFTASRESHPYEGYLHVHGYASHSPCSDGQRVFVHFGNSGIYAFDLDGNKLWGKDVGSAVGGFGSAGSPVVINGMLIVNASIESERLLALNPESGDEVWSTRLGQSYTTPVHVRASGRDEIIVPSGRDGRGVVGFDASNGQPLWEWKGYKSNRYICASPIFHGGVIYATGSVDGPLGAIRPGGNGDVTESQQVWRDAPFNTDVTSPVYHNGNVFWLGGRSVVFDSRTGDRVGQARIGGGCWATPLLAEDRLYVVTQVEGVRIFEANAEMNEIAQNVIREPGPQDNWNASPVPDRGQLLLRSPKTLYCIGQ